MESLKVKRLMNNYAYAITVNGNIARWEFDAFGRETFETFPNGDDD